MGFELRANAIFTSTGPAAWNANEDLVACSGLDASASWTTSAGGSNGTNGVAANFCNQPTDAPGEYLIRFLIDDAAIFLNGTPVALADLPAGFTIVQLEVLATNLQANVINTPYVSNSVNGISFYLQFDQTTESNAITPDASSDNYNFIYPGPGFPNIVQLVSNGFGLRTKLGLNSHIITQLTITGAYTTPINQWSVSPGSLTLPDNIVTITRPDPGVPPDQDMGIIQNLVVNGVTIGPNDPGVILWTLTIIIFWFTPDLVPTGGGSVNIDAIPAGTQFSGTVNIGSLNVTVADLSGIYTFDTTVHHDNLYDRSGTTVATQVVAIPAPFFVTAFFNDNEQEVMHYTGVRMRVTGAGTLKRVFQSYDVINTEQLADLTMRTATNTLPFALANFIDQNAALRVYTSSTDDYMVVSSLVVYINPIYTGYPQ